MRGDIKTNFIKDYQPGPDAVVELYNGKFTDVINEAYFPGGGSIFIKGGKILTTPEAVNDPEKINPDFQVDLQGKAVMPGLFNTHCHVQMLMPTLLPTWQETRIAKRYRQMQLDKNMSDCLSHGVTYIRDAMSDDLRLNRILKKRIDNREQPGPRILQSVVVTQPDGYFSQKYGLVMRIMRAVLGMPTLDFDDKESGILVFPADADERTVRDAVDRAVDERGAEAIKVPEQRMNLSSLKDDLSIMTMGQLEALTDQARKRGLQSTIHQVTVETFQRGVAGRVSSLAHMARDRNLSNEDTAAFIDADCIFEPTLSVGYDVAWPLDGVPAADHPDMKRLCEFRDNAFSFADLADRFYIPELRESVRRSYEYFVNGRMKLLGLIDMTRMMKLYASVASYGVENFRKLFEGGARMALANDGGISPCTPAMMGHELALFDLFLNHDPERRVFSGADALKIATINSACSMGVQDRFGSLEAGKVADLVLVEGDPLADFRVVGSRAAAVFMDGRLVVDNCGLEIRPTG